MDFYIHITCLTDLQASNKGSELLILPALILQRLNGSSHPENYCQILITWYTTGYVQLVLPYII